jgi:hypothetical protein
VALPWSSAAIDKFAEEVAEEVRDVYQILKCILEATLLHIFGYANEKGNKKNSRNDPSL